MPDAPSASHDGLQVLDLARRFGPRWAVARVNLHVPRGGACMVTGANGSGKTTLLRCVATALRPHHGEIRFEGRDLWRERMALRPQVALLSHATRLYEDLDARGNLIVWARLGGLRADPAALLERVGLASDRREPVRTFSAGMRRRLALARVLLKRPALLLLDEPFTALDPDGRALLIERVRELRAGGTTVLVATHVPDVAAAICDQRVHMEDGRFVAAPAGPVE